jgi:uncharacterized protein YjlB
MGLLEDTKRTVERITGLRRPSSETLSSALRERKPHRYRFRKAGLVPNHPKWPLVLYRSPVRLPDGVVSAAFFEDLFESNGWSDSWRDGVYDYLHYHSRIHEVMGVARGSAVVRFGGARGRKLGLKVGDVLVLPAGTGHVSLSASKDFLVVGAYPATGTYDVCKPTEANYRKPARTVPRVPPPRRDPVYGKDGALVAIWKKSSAR